MTAWMTTTAPPTPGAATAGAASHPLLDVEAAGGVDLDRVERALELAADRIGHGRYRVRGGAQDHWVDLFTAAHPRCDCGDHLWRDAVCKHILAALLREGDPRVVSAVGQVVARLRERLAEARGAPAARRAA